MITNITLGMILCDDRPMLERVVPTYDDLFEKRVAIDTGSRDKGDDLLDKRGWLVVHSAWKNDYSLHRNQLVQIADFSGNEWLLMLDADEAMFPDDLKRLSEWLTTCDSDVVFLPRYNLAGPGFDWLSTSFPDYQCRVISMNSSVTFVGNVHETPRVNGATPPLDTFDAPIFHYGLCRDPGHIWFRCQNYDRLLAGHFTVNRESVSPPESVRDHLSHLHLVPFNRPHPLAP
jgi:glycosyltransferase involved in cell wall biosynthesis